MRRNVLKRKKPIYIIRKETVLSQDEIRPYGGDRIEVSSEALRRKMALKLLTLQEETDVATIDGRKKKSFLNVLEELHSKEIMLSEEEIIRLMEIQTLISNERKISLSFEGLRSFLLRAMNYNGFQLEKENDVRLKSFLSVTTDEEILALYDVEENYDEKNLASLDNFINASNIGNAFDMQVNESGNGFLPAITKTSRKKLVKSLLNKDK